MKSSGQLSNVLLLVVGVMIIYGAYIIIQMCWTLLNKPSSTENKNATPTLIISKTCFPKLPTNRFAIRADLLPMTEGFPLLYSDTQITASTIDSVQLIARWGAGENGKYMWGQGVAPIHDMSLYHTLGMIALATDMGMEIRSLYDGTVVCYQNRTHGITEIELGRHGTLLALKPNHKSVELWDLTTNQLETVIPESKDIISLGLQSNGSVLGMVTPNNESNPTTVTIWHVNSSRPITETVALGATEVSFGSGEWYSIVSIGGRETTTLYDTESVERRATLEHGKTRSAVIFHPDGQQLLLFSFYQIQLWNVASDRTIWESETMTSRINDVAISPNGEWLATVHDDGKLRIRDALTGTLLAELEGQVGKGTGVEISPTSDIILTSNLDGTVSVWGIP